MKKSFLHLMDDGNGALQAMYFCPHCYRTNFIQADQALSECGCGHFLMDLGQRLEAFLRDAGAEAPAGASQAA